VSSAPPGPSGRATPAAGPPRAAPSPEAPAAETAVPGTVRATGWRAAAGAYLPAVVAPAVAGAAMLVAGLWGLERHSSMGNDEVVTRWAALLSLRQLFHLLGNVDAVHGLYYLLMHGWMAVGTSPAVMRVPSVIAMVAAVALTVTLGRRLTGSSLAGLLAGLIMAFTPVISFYAQTARSYALLIACVLGATLALVHALAAEAGGEPRARRLRWWVCYAALVALGGYLNEMALLVLAAHAVTVALGRYGRPVATRWAAAAAGGAVLVTPLLVVSATEAGAIGWIPRPALWDLKVLFHDYFGPSLVAGALLAACVVVALWPPGAGLPAGATVPAGGNGPVVPWWRRGGVSLPSVAAPLLTVPAALLLLESLVARPLYVDRYVLYGEAGAALLAGAGAWRAGYWLAGRWPAGRAAASSAAGRGSRWLLWAPGIAVCLCALLLQLGAQHRARTPQSRLFDFGGPSRYVAAHARAGDGIVYLSDFFRKAELGYPADFRAVSDLALAVPPARAGTFQGVDKPFAAVRALMLAHGRIWSLGRRPSAGLPTPLARAESQLLGSAFTPAGEHRFKGIVVILWVRR
jgi:mannosyltransferase